MSGCDGQLDPENVIQKRVLISLLLINGLMFVFELGLGIYAQSTALIGDSLDMLADAAVYGIGLYAVGRSVADKARAASISGLLQIGLGFLVILDVIRRFVQGSEPDSVLMVGVGVIALIANVICLKLISRHRYGDVHMRASWIFSRNDVIANLGTVLAGLMVFLLGTSLPDLFIGCLIALVVIKGGLTILQKVKRENHRIKFNSAGRK